MTTEIAKNSSMTLKHLCEKEKTEAALAAYTETINDIDDYFEYASESQRDRNYVHEILGKLTEKLTKIYKHKQV